MRATTAKPRGKASQFSPPSEEIRDTRQRGKLTKIWVRISTLGVVHLTDDIPYSGDISTHAFLKRISGHLSLMGKALPRNITREREDVDDLAESPILILPGKANATEYMDCFFEHLNATYRYLPRGENKKNTRSSLSGRS